MITIILDYAVVSPITVEQYVLNSTYMVNCRCYDIDEDYFEVVLFPWDNDEDSEIDIAVMAEKIIEIWGIK